MKRLAFILLLAAATTAQAQIATKGLILDLDADKGVEVEDGDRVVRWTNQVTSFSAKDFLKRDQDTRSLNLIPATRDVSCPVDSRIGQGSGDGSIVSIAPSSNHCTGADPEIELCQVPNILQLRHSGICDVALAQGH